VIIGKKITMGQNNNLGHVGVVVAETKEAVIIFYPHGSIKQGQAVIYATIK